MTVWLSTCVYSSSLTRLCPLSFPTHLDALKMILSRISREYFQPGLSQHKPHNRLVQYDGIVDAMIVTSIESLQPL